MPKGAVRKWGVGILTVNKICFKHFVFLLLCVCVHNWSVSQQKQYELQIWSSWRNIIFWKWKAPQNSTPENGHAHGEYFRCFQFHSCTWRIKTLPQSPTCTEEILLYTVHIKSISTKFCFWQSGEELTFSFIKTLLHVTVVRHCIRRQCFILLPNIWVVFKIYFAIPHKIVAINNVQQSIKQARGKKIIVLLHYIQLAMLHIWVICFEHMAAWKRCSDMRKVCGNIFEDCKRHNVQLNLNVHQRFSQILRLYDDIYTGTCWIF